MLFMVPPPLLCRHAGLLPSPTNLTLQTHARLGPATVLGGDGICGGSWHVIVCAATIPETWWSCAVAYSVQTLDTMVLRAAGKPGGPACVGPRCVGASAGPLQRHSTGRDQLLVVVSREQGWPCWWLAMLVVDLVYSSCRTCCGGGATDYVRPVWLVTQGEE